MFAIDFLVRITLRDSLRLLQCFLRLDCQPIHLHIKLLVPSAVSSRDWSDTNFTNSINLNRRQLRKRTGKTPIFPKSLTTDCTDQHGLGEQELNREFTRMDAKPNYLTGGN